MLKLDSGCGMLDDQAMAHQWIVRVADKDYGPADIETLREWKLEGRVVAQNPARRADIDSAAAGASAEEPLWITAAEIPELFEKDQHDATSFPRSPAHLHPLRSFPYILRQTFRVYRKGFFQFFYLTLLVALPGLCAQLSGSAVETSSPVNPDLRTAVAAAFTLCMLMLSLAAWPVFLAGIQILTDELVAGRPARIFGIFDKILKFWPRVTILCLFVYGVFALLMVFAIAVMAMIVVGASSPFMILLALGLLIVQIWMFGRFFINMLFWQQFAVLADSQPGTALRQSKALARSGRNFPWYQRPMWRGAFIASLWILFVFLLNVGPEWSFIRQYFHIVSTSTDPQVMLESLRANSQPQAFDAVTFSLGLLQALLRPLLGIAFVLLYFDALGRAEADIEPPS